MMRSIAKRILFGIYGTAAEYVDPRRVSV